MEREDLGLRVWVRGEGEGARARAGSGEGERVGGEEKRESFKCCGPNQLNPVQPVAPTGQTGSAQTDRKNFGFSDLSCELN